MLSFKPALIPLLIFSSLQTLASDHPVDVSATFVTSPNGDSRSQFAFKRLESFQDLN